MALYDTEFGLPQSMVDYLNQGLPSIQQPYRPGYDKNYGPGKGMGYTAVMPQPGYQYVYGPDGQRYSIPIPGYNPNEDADDPQGIVSLYPEGDDDRGGEFTPQIYSNVPTGEPSDFEKGLKKLMQGGLGGFLSGILPEESPQMKAAKSFYRNQYGLTPGGSVASGIMAGYNPVSGGLLNMLTQGAVGRPPNVGLQRAYQQRINMIKNTLAKKYADGDYSGTQLDEKLAELQKLKTEEQMAMEKPAIDRARAAAPDVYREADRQGFTGPGGGFSTSGSKKDSGFESRSSKPSGRGRQDF
jgi:hypothetical protein